MSDWLTYSLSDFLLFSPRTYYRLFELYNRAVWPAQIVALAAGLALILLRRRPGRATGRAVAAILAAAWLWVAWAYLVERYGTINWAASYLAVGFAVEAALIAAAGALGRLHFEPPSGPRARIALGIVAFAVGAYPLIAPLLGRPLAQAEVFGIAPDPTAIATLGVLLTAASRHAWALLVIPVLWCAISAATLWTMGSPDAFVPAAAAAAAIVLSGWKTASPRDRSGAVP